MKRAILILLFFSLFALTSGHTKVPANRVALVIGNSDYSNQTMLKNPANDANAVAESLRKLGFKKVLLKLDLDAGSFLKALKEFSRVSRNADLAMIYYAGHAIEYSGKNFLIPTDASLVDDSDIEFETVPLRMLMNSVSRVRNLKLIVLDACRDNPFRSKLMSSDGATRSIKRGLARVSPNVRNTLIAYAAKEETVALDGTGKHSPYAAALLQHLETPGLEIGRLFRKVRDSVLESTQGQQEPFVYGSISGEEIYFKEPAAPGTPTVIQDPVAAAWSQVKASADVRNIEAFLLIYGAQSEHYASLARQEIEKLTKKNIATLKPQEPDKNTIPQPVNPGTQVLERPDWPISDACREDLRSWRSKASVGAFAIEKQGGCGWSWGNKTVKEAKQNAMTWCKKQGPECKVIEVHTTQKGDWTLSTGCKEDFDSWKTKRSFGAFAAERSGACGWAWGYETLQAAKKAAIEYCSTHGPECKVIDTHNTNKGDWTLSDGCTKDLKAWRDKARIGAFTVEQSGACGWSWGHKTRKEAVESALKACRTHGPECKVLETHVDAQDVADVKESPEPEDPVRKAWLRVKSSGNLKSLEAFLQLYGKDSPHYAELAQQEINRLKGTDVATLDPDKGLPDDPGTKVVAKPGWPMSEACREDLRSWRTKSSVGAFAIEKQGGCGWSWGNETLAQARKNAMTWCKKQGPNCKVIEVHTEQKGDWTMSSGCQEDYEKWKIKRSFGAFAVERGGACGWSWGYETLKAAKEGALKYCKTYGDECKVVKTHSKNKGDWTMSDACQTDYKSWKTKASVGAFAVERSGACGWTWGNKTLEQAKKSALEYCSTHGKECKIIDTHTKQKGDWSLSDNCREDLKKWRKKKKKAAFAVSRGGACGWSWGYQTKKQASKRALAECRKYGRECRVIKTK